MSVVELSQGSSFAGYRIDGVIGRGGMGVVYRATDLSLERPVALKLIAPELATDEGFRRRFLRESKLAASLGHPHILPVHAAGEENGQLYLAMRLVEGEDLKALIARDSKLDTKMALHICGQIAEALDAAHQRGLVHRDVKPANVLLDEGGQAYLADFGLTKQVGGASTRSDEIAGTLDYLAPEQIRGEQVTGQTDQYALACVLYECLGGQPPFHRRTEAEVLWAHMQEAPRSLDHYAELDQVFARGLAKDKDERFATCVDLIDTARETLGLETPRGRRRRRLLRRSRLLVGAGALILVGAIAALAVALTGDGASTTLLASGSVGRIDADAGRVVGHVRVGAGPVRLVSDGRAVWVGSDESRTVSALDQRTLEPSKVVATGGFPSDLAFDEGSIWMVDGKSGLLYKVDAAYGTVSGKTRVSTAPPWYDSSREGLDPVSVAAGLGSVWLTDGSSELVRVDPRTPRVVDRIDLRTPLNGAAVGAGAVWAVSGKSATVFRVDRDGAVTARIPIVSQPGFESPYPLSVRVGEGSVWVLNGNTATITRIDPRQRTVLATISIGIDRGPVRLAVGIGAAWVANGDGTLSRIDAGTNDVETIAVGHRLKDVAIADGAVFVTAGSGLSSSVSATYTGRSVRALPNSSCSPIYYGGGNNPQFLIASDLPLQGPGRTEVAQLSQAIQFILRQRGFRAGRYAVGYQSCDDSTAEFGAWTKEKCAANARAYAENRSVIGVIGAWNSACSASEIPILNEAPGGPLAMISPSNTYIGLTRGGISALPSEPDDYYPTGRRNYARVVSADDIQGVAHAIFAKRVGADRVYLLDDGVGYGKALATLFESAANDLGLDVVGAESWDPRASSVQLVAAVKAARPDAVFLGTVLFPESEKLLRALRAALPRSTKILVPDGFAPAAGLIEVVGPTAEGMIVSDFGVPNAYLPRAGRQFVEEFSRAIGETPHQWPAFAAQATAVLLDAIARSDGTRSSVTQELFKTKVRDGILGDFEIDRNGDTTAGAVTFYRIVRGKPHVAAVIKPPKELGAR